jgi:hypothetical protein
MEDKPHPTEELLACAKEYVKINFELYKLKAVEKSANLVSTLLTNMLILALISLSFLIVNLGVALWIGKLLGAYFYGFFVVGGFYAIVAIGLFIFRDKWLKNPIANLFIKQLLPK